MVYYEDPVQKVHYNGDKFKWDYHSGNIVIEDYNGDKADDDDKDKDNWIVLDVVLLFMLMDQSWRGEDSSKYLQYI